MNSIPNLTMTERHWITKRWKLLMAEAEDLGQVAASAFTRCCMANGWLILLALVGISTALKFAAGTGGWNYDFESYRVVADIVASGGNVYSETSRYNYGPIWFVILGWMNAILGHHMRLGIILLLSLADAGIAAMLWRRSLFFPAALFLLSNITIHISGFHNQFDNVAVFTAFAALALMESAQIGGGEPRRRFRYWGGVALLGLSITTKHVFAFLPIWFLFRRMSWKRKALSFMLPLAIFAASFLPYSGITDAGCRKAIAAAVAKTREYSKTMSPSDAIRRSFREEIMPLDIPVRGIVKNVFLYKSSSTKNLYRCFLPHGVYEAVPTRLLFVLCMIGLGVVMRGRSLFAGGLAYTLGMFTFPSAMAIQYYAIPSAAAAVYWRPFGLCFHICGSIALLFGHGEGAVNPFVLVPCMLMTLGCLVVAAHPSCCRNGRPLTVQGGKAPVRGY